jgi:DNA-binding Xre family transcriptional regulator
MGTKSRVSPTNEELVEFQTIVTALKKILKDRKISYADLAKRLHLSESGTKKIFAGSDCSFTRLSQICRVLGFKMSDLLNEVDRAESNAVRFTPEQQKYFLNDMKAFRFFVKLVVERQNLEKVRDELGLNERETFALLKKLDGIRVLQLHPGNKIKLPPLRLVKNFGEGPLLEKVYRDWGRQIVDELAHPRFQKDGQFIVRTLSMKESTYKELLSRLLELEAEFLRRSVREMSVSASPLRPTRWMWLTDAKSFV